MPTIERFEDIRAWQVARELRIAVYALTQTGVFATDYALVNQLRRAAVSVTSNIAEGFERGGNREFLQFLSQAKGSLGEIKDQLRVAYDQRYISQEQFDQTHALADYAARLTGAFMKYLRQPKVRGPKFPASATPNP